MEDFSQIRQHLITYNPAGDHTVYQTAQGVRYIDEEGRAFINMNDIACVLGYAHPRFTAGLAQLVQTKMLGHPGMLSREKEELVGRFMRVTGGQFDKIHFTGSGGEVVDWCLKAARKYTGRDRIISFRHALHGRSFAGAYISDIPYRKVGFGTGLEHVDFWDYPGDGRPCEPAADDGTDIAAIIIEPYQAAGDMASPSPAYWQWLRQYTREKGIVLILDEIQTGFGKTGSFFAYQEAGIVPDILLVGKGMSNGFGLGAMLMNREIGTCLTCYEMSGGSADNDLMCSIVNLIFDIYEQEDLLAHVRQMGSLLQSSLTGLFAQYGVEAAVQGRGLFFSLALPHGLAERIVPMVKARGVLLGRHGDKLNFRPPLVISEQDIMQVCAAVRGAMDQCSREDAANT